MARRGYIAVKTTPDVVEAVEREMRRLRALGVPRVTQTLAVEAIVQRDLERQRGDADRSAAQADVLAMLERQQEVAK